MRRRHELTDAQWQRVGPLLPGRAGDPGRTAADNRLFVDAVLYVLKTGIPWEDRPARYGKPNSAWKRFDRWCAAGVWERLAEAPGDPDLGEVPLDSTSVKAHPVATPGRRRPEGKKRRPTGGRAWAAAGGGPTTKAHPAVDRRGRLRRLILTAGQRGDAPQAEPLLDGFEPGAVGHVLADAAYDSDAIRRRVKRMGATACLRPNPTRKVRKRYDRRRSRNRSVVERSVGGIKRHRPVATRYEKKAANFAGFVWPAALLIELD